MDFKELKFPINLLEDGMIISGPFCHEIVKEVVNKSERKNIVAIDRTREIAKALEDIKGFLVLDLSKYRLNPLKQFGKDISYIHRILTIASYSMGRNEARISTSNKLYEYSKEEEITATGFSSEVTEDELDGLEIVLREANKNLSGYENFNFLELSNKNTIFDLSKIRLQDEATLLAFTIVARIKELWDPRSTIIILNYPELYFRYDRTSTNKLQIFYEILELKVMGFKLVLLTYDEEGIPSFIRNILGTKVETKEKLSLNENFITRKIEVEIYTSSKEENSLKIEFRPKVKEIENIDEIERKSYEILIKEEEKNYIIKVLEQDFGSKAKIAYEIIKEVSGEPVKINELVSKISSIYGKNAASIINKMVRLRYLTFVETEEGMKITLSEKGRNLLNEGEGK